MFTIDPGRLEFLPANDDHVPARCDTCRQVWWRSLEDVCPSYRCEGTLRPFSGDGDDGEGHYRRLYTALATIGVRVEEHTAQLEAEWAGRIQQEFIDGAVNVLSCSTTFELGVDLGEVQAVLCRNVPPSPANYVQRAGRAGRRTGSAALVVTYAQRRNHDRHFFEHPQALVDGVVSAPVVRIDNPAIVRRHLHAVAFAAFERNAVDDGGEAHKNVESFFLEPAAAPGRDAPVDEFVAWLRSHPTELGDALERIAPGAVQDELGVHDWSWVDALTIPDDVTGFGWLTRARNEAQNDIADVAQQIADAVEKQNYSYAGVLKRVRATLALRSVFEFLAQRTVLPKYGFPVDVVSLDVSKDSVEGARLDLNRDLRLGIVDYAPGAKIVAAKAMWEPTGLRIPAGQALLRHGWAVCGSCRAFRSRLGDHAELCACGSSQTAKRGLYVIPTFGFIGRRSSEEPGESRPPRSGFGDRNFSDYAGPEPAPEVVPVGAGHIERRHSRQGQITVLNRGPGGRGFRLCFFCGYGEPAPAGPRGRPPAHRMPGNTRRECDGRLEFVQLGHQYLTDVVELRLGLALSEDAALSTLYALLASTHAVGILPTDVDGTLRFLGQDTAPALVLFDAVPGGAGHALRVSELLPELFQAALAVAESCECGEDTSCYGCLRSYSNQAVHERLQRGAAAATFRAVLGGARAVVTER